MRVFRFAAGLWIAVALGVNAWVHWRLAPTFDANAAAWLSQGDLFRIQAIVNVLAAVLVLVRPRPWSAVIAGIVALGGLVLVVTAVLVPLDLTPFGLPYLYEPSWYPDKVLVVVSQALATAGAIILAGLARHAPET